MTMASHANGAKANFGGAMNCTVSGKKLPSISSVMRAARSWWPSKTAAALALATGADERTAKYWLAEKFEPSASALIRLIRSDPRVLDVLLGDIEWWERQRAQQRIADLEAELAELKSKRR